MLRDRAGVRFGFGKEHPLIWGVLASLDRCRASWKLRIDLYEADTVLTIWNNLDEFANERNIL